MLEREKLNKLIEKYGVAVPRYTSYPTAPEWKQEFSQELFEAAIHRSNSEGGDYSIYVHIPFCESQCYYCGCNVVISPQHGIERTYLEQLKDEISYYGERIDKDRQVRQLAWGGGTPTYLSPEQILELYSHIAKNFSLAKDNYEYSIEIDPRVTTKAHLEALKEAGFNRLSMGVQDFNLKTQEAINRVQSFADTSLLVEQARELGFDSINFDLIYGLPYQSLGSFIDTIEKVKQINPERIAFFNYAHIPSIFPYQKKYIEEMTLPDQAIKMEIFDRAVAEFTNFGYEFIGLDHFAKPDDGLAVAQKEKSLYRNFQGYTTFAGCDLLGLGISSISDVQGCYKQNVKKVNDYYQEFLSADKFMQCSEDDIERREMIKQIMCNGYLELDPAKYAAEIAQLEPYINDGLLVTSENCDSLEITDLGRFFVRNIASCFDSYLPRESSHKLFSKAL